MSKFEIKSFFEFSDGGAVFSLNTAQGMYYECKLVAYNGGHFLTSAQSRQYDKKDGGKGHANAFGAVKDSAAAKFFDEVAEAAKKLLKSQSGNDQAKSGFNPDDEDMTIPF